MPTFFAKPPVCRGNKGSQLFVLVSALLGLFPSTHVNADPHVDAAHQLHFNSIVMDTHDDTTQRLVWDHFDLSKRGVAGSIDLPRMKQGGLGGIFFSIWTPGTLNGPIAARQALDQIDAVRQIVGGHPHELTLCTTAAEVRKAHAAGRIAVLMGVEGGHMIDNDLGLLRIYAALGVRYLTLTHTENTDWADSSGDKPAHQGLTDFGRQVIAELNRDGIMVDISHVSDKTFWDALASSKAPLIASHSSCRALCAAPRNMSDEMIKALAAKGGVIQINYHMGFLDEAFRQASDNSTELKSRQDQADKQCGDNQSCQQLAEDQVVRAMVSEGKLPRVDWTEIVDHIDHAVKIAGVEHVGLGSDFDGAFMPYGMEDASELPKITAELLRRGYSDSAIRDILGENTLRLMERVQRVSRDIQAQSGAP